MIFRAFLAALLFLVLSQEGAAAGDPISSLMNPTTSIPSLNIDNKKEVSCEKIQTGKPFVILSLGQSLVGNHNGTPSWWKSGPKRVFEFWSGHCYEASYPLYGATGDRKSFILPLADLVAQATHGDVLLLTVAAGGADIARFSRNGDLNDLVKSQITGLKRAGLKPTIVLFEMGQVDRDKKIKYFKRMISSMISSFRAISVDAPFFITIDTRLSWSIKSHLPTQEIIIGNPNTYIGPKIDLIVNRPDGTHFDEEGILLQAGMWFQSINYYFDW